MARATSVIKINGASYDATTGNAIGSTSRLAPIAVIDGFVKRTRSVKASGLEPKTKSAKAKPRPARENPGSTAKGMHHRAERSKTLVRSGVDKPTLKIRSAVQTMARPVSNKISLDAIKASRAAQITRHAAVSRFGLPSQKQQAKHVSEAQAVRVRPRAMHAATASAPATTTSHHRLERMLDEALVNADAHKQLIRQQRYSRMPFKRFLMWPRWVQIIIVALVILIVGLFLVWRYVPQVSVNLVARRAHVNATVPTYVPAGFSFKKATSLPSGVSIQYQDKNSGSDNYSIAQTKSSADSASTATNNIAKGSAVQTAQVNGNTVYIYGNQNNAVWVNNGTEYTITNDAGLSSEQLLHIAQGL